MCDSKYCSFLRQHCDVFVNYYCVQYSVQSELLLKACSQRDLTCAMHAELKTDLDGLGFDSMAVLKGSSEVLCICIHLQTHHSTR